MTLARQRKSDAARVSTFSSLRVRNYRLFTIGQAISVGGNWMQNIAVGWLTLQLSHSGIVLGIVTGARYLPVVLFSAWGGVVADRVDNRRLLTVTQTSLAALSFLLGVLSAAGVITLAALLGIVLMLGFVNVLDGPARQSFISQLVDSKHLANAIVLNSVVLNAAKMIGPGIGGAVIVAFGVTPCFFVDAFSFVAVIVSLLLLDTAKVFPPRRETRSSGQIRAGLSHIAHTPALRYPLLMVVVTGVLTWEFPVSVPLMTTSTFQAGADAYGIAMACMSAGAVVGGLVAARRRRVTVPALAISAVLWGGLITAAALAPVLPVMYAILVFVGVGSITFNSSAKTLLQVEAAPHMRGRVMSLWWAAWQGGTVIGAPLVGGVASWLGARYGLLLSGIAATAIGTIVLAACGRSQASGSVRAMPGRR